MSSETSLLLNSGGIESGAGRGWARAFLRMIGSAGILLGFALLGIHFSDTKEEGTESYGPILPMYIRGHVGKHHHSHSSLVPIEDISMFELQSTPLTALNPDRSWHNLDLATSFEQPTVGSDIVWNKDTSTFVGLTDATPLKTKCPSDHSQDWLPFPDFAPGMVSLGLAVDNSVTGSYAPMNISGASPLKAQDGTYLTSNPPKSVNDSEKFLDSTFRDKECRFGVFADPGGVDTEGLDGPLRDGTFVVGEEYGPSILHVKPDGTVIARYSPEMIHLPRAYYPVKPILPGVLSNKRHNRGFESAFVIEREGKEEGCGILQSPLGDKKHSLIVRVVCVDLAEERMSGVYLLKLDDHKRMINSATGIQGTRFLYLERHSDKGTAYTVDADSGTNILDHPKLDTLDFEDPDFDFDAEGITLLDKTPIFEYPNQYLEDRKIIVSSKIEGIAKVDEMTLAMTNDNDYGKSGEPSRLWLIKFNAPY